MYYTTFDGLKIHFVTTDVAEVVMMVVHGAFTRLYREKVQNHEMRVYWNSYEPSMSWVDT